MFRPALPYLFLVLSSTACYQGKVTAKGILFSNSEAAYSAHSQLLTVDDTLIVPDTARKDTLKPAGDADDLRSKVHYTAEDTIRFDVEHDKVYLYKKAEITYENMNLKAGRIDIDWETRTLFARGIPDSLGNMTELPVFTQDNQNFTAHTMRYNFDTKKGKITYVKTKEGEGYIHGETVKRDSTNDFYIRNGKYTTCDLDTPHFYIASNKLRIINQKKIVTGPAYLVIENVPTPLVIPFGFFPNKKGRSSGIIFPAYGESASRGFFLQRLGYYFGFSDNVVAAVTGDIYTLGSYLVNVSSDYAVRYHFRGNLRMNYSVTKTSEKELGDYSVRKDFLVNWFHAQDAKAHPGSQFGASVQFGTGNFYRNNLSSPQNYLGNTYRSSISYSKSWAGTPFSLSSALSHSQNTLTREIEVSAPDVSFNVARINPFKRKNGIGEDKWYEKIGASYSMHALNSISTYDSLLFKKESIDKLNTGIMHTLPVSTSFKMFKFFSLSPSANYTERWYFRTIEKHYDAELGKAVNDTNRQFSAARNYSVSASLSTRVYGMFLFQKSPIAALRHVLTPSVGFTYTPDFSEARYGYYKNVVTDSLGHQQVYSIYEGQIFGGPGRGKTGTVSFALDNNLEMKVRTQTDTGMTLKKIKLLESLSFASGYNLAADSLNWQPISVNGRTTLFDKVNISMGASFDPYITDTLGQRINQFEYDVNGRLARLTSANASLSAGIAGGKNDEKKKKMEEENMNPADYIDFSVPWSLNVSYSLTYSKPNERSTPETRQHVSFSGDISLTQRWKIGYSSGYDFQAHDFTYSSFSFYRDMHCWEMRLTWIPFGFQQSYSFQINVKSSILQDLKLTKKNDFYDR